MLSQSLSELVELTYTRLLVPRETGGAAYDVTTGADAQARGELLGLLARHSDLSGQFHAVTRDPWCFLWTKGRTHVVPFHDRPFSLIAWRDPIGPTEGREGALRLFKAYAESRGKHAMMLATSAGIAAAGETLGFGSIWVGAEPFFELARWNTRGKTGEKLRLAVNHARPLGCTGGEIFPRTDPAVRKQLWQVEQAWKNARPARRNPSFLRTAPMENAEHRRYFAVHRETAAGPVMESFLVCSPVSREGYYLQDLVRNPDAPRGATELVNLSAMEAFRSEGVRFVTMGIVPLFKTEGTREATGKSAGVINWGVRYFDRVYNFSGLQQFRAKFVPSWWEQVHVLYWPRFLTPMVGWDIVSVVAPPF